MANIKVFVHATDVEADTDHEYRDMTLAPRTYLSGVTQKGSLG